MPRILCIHGVGHVEADPGWQQDWTAAIQGGLQLANPNVRVSFDFLGFDELFDFPLSAATIVEALADMTASGVDSALSGIEDWWEGLLGRRRGLLGDNKSQVGWTA